jgi:hypothetical protein
MDILRRSQEFQVYDEEYPGSYRLDPSSRVEGEIIPWLVLPASEWRRFVLLDGGWPGGRGFQPSEPSKASALRD